MPHSLQEQSDRRWRGKVWGREWGGKMESHPLEQSVSPVHLSMCLCVCETRDACTSLKVKSESERREVAIFGECIFTKRWIHRKLRTRVARSGPCVASRCPGFYSVFRNMSRMLRSNEEAGREKRGKSEWETGERKWDWKSGEDGTRWDEKLAEQNRHSMEGKEDAPESILSRLMSLHPLKINSLVS